MEIYSIVAFIVFIYTISRFKKRHYNQFRQHRGNPDISVWKIRVAFYVTSAIVAIAFPITVTTHLYKKWRKYRVYKTQQRQDQP